MPVVHHPAGRGEDGNHHQQQLQPILGQVAVGCVKSGIQIYLRKFNLIKNLDLTLMVLTQEAKSKQDGFSSRKKARPNTMVPIKKTRGKLDSLNKRNNDRYK